MRQCSRLPFWAVCARVVTLVDQDERRKCSNAALMLRCGQASGRPATALLLPPLCTSAAHMQREDYRQPSDWLACQHTSSLVAAALVVDSGLSQEINAARLGDWGREEIMMAGDDDDWHNDLSLFFPMLARARPPVNTCAMYHSHRRRIPSRWARPTRRPRKYGNNDAAIGRKPVNICSRIVAVVATVVVVVRIAVGCFFCKRRGFGRPQTDNRRAQESARTHTHTHDVS